MKAVTISCLSGAIMTALFPVRCRRRLPPAPLRIENKRSRANGPYAFYGRMGVANCSTPRVTHTEGAAYWAVSASVARRTHHSQNEAPL